MWFVCDGVLSRLVGKAFSHETLVDPSGIDSVFLSLTNPPRGIDFVGNRGREGFHVYFGIVIKASKGFVGYYVPWIGIVYIHTR